LWWEGSAAIYRAEALHATGIWDTNYDIALGVCGDNDYFYRMRQAGYSLYRNGSMRFFHIKGLTQTAFGREPFDKSSDIHKQRNLEYFYQKWNIRLEG
jgi:GT2 family glycosyltransferase